jgi:hypothetical protein
MHPPSISYFYVIRVDKTFVSIDKQQTDACSQTGANPTIFEFTATTPAL